MPSTALFFTPAQRRFLRFRVGLLVMRLAVIAGVLLLLVYYRVLP